MTSKLSRWRVCAACLVVAAGLLAVSGGAGAGVAGAASVTTNGTWPGVGKVCGGGSGGATPTTRGVADKSIHIAVFNDAANTVQPGLEIEFIQMAKAFAAWCNASGGINGRKIIVDNRDGALFNAAQVTSEACQSDFMSVGGGLVFDATSTPVRVKCGLGQITGYTVSDAAVDAPLQVNPAGINNDVLSAGWFTVLAKEYPSAVQKSGFGAQNNPSITESETKYKIAAEAQGWKVIDFQEPPLSVPDWTPYIQQSQTKGVEALWPSNDSNIAPYVQAMNTAGYNPTFMILGTQFADTATEKAAAEYKFPKTYIETQLWPLSMASKNPSTEQMVNILHKYSPGDTIDFYDEEQAGAWLLWAKSATACGSHLTVSCVLSHAATEKNWDAGGISAPVAQLTMSDDNPTPSPCFALMQVKPNAIVYDKTATKPTSSIWNCDPKGLVHFTPSDQKQIAAAS